MWSMAVLIYVVCLQISETGAMSTPELNLYLDEMQKDGTWGDGIVLSVAVLLYNRPIIIILPDGHTQSIDAAVPLPDKEPIRLGLVTNHYVSIVSDPCMNNNIGNNPNNQTQNDHHVIMSANWTSQSLNKKGIDNSLENAEKLKVSNNGTSNSYTITYLSEYYFCSLGLQQNLR